MGATSHSQPDCGVHAAESRSHEDEKGTPDAGTGIESASRRKLLLTAGTVTAAVGVVGGPLSGGVLADDVERQKGSVIAPPYQGEWMVLNPPGHPALADDFIGMKAGYRLPYPASAVPRHLLAKLPVSCAYGWRRPVYAPVEGTVLEMSDDAPDGEHVNLFSNAVDTLVAPPTVEDGDIRPAAGNYVVIGSDDGVAFLAHLRQGSVAVTDGMHVGLGEFLGEIGNSGASLFPHLHFQLMRNWTNDITEMDELLLPYRFAIYERRTGSGFRGHSWEPVEKCVPEQGVRFRVPPNSNTKV